MSTPRDFSRASWRLKFERAKQHLSELERHLTIYSDRHPYRIEWERQKDTDPQKWRLMLRITEQPPPELAVIIGDVVHNARSGLNHLGVALAGRTDAGFPIYSSDPFATRSDGSYVNLKARENFEGATRGMNDAAIAILKRLQPYSDWPVSPQCPTGLRFWRNIDGKRRIEPGEPSSHYLGVLSRMNNADKHKRLVAIASGIIDGEIVYTKGGEVQAVTRFPDAALADNAQVTTATGPKHPDETNMKVEVQGAVHVMVRFGAPEGPAPIVHALRPFTDELPEVVFAALEPFVK